MVSIAKTFDICIVSVLLLLLSAQSSAADDFADCDAKAVTTYDLEMCAGMLRDREYAELDSVYSQLMANASSKGRKKLKAARNAWERYRQLQCELETSGHEDASLYNMLIVQCWAGVTHEYTETLKRHLNCVEGDLSCGID